MTEMEPTSVSMPTEAVRELVFGSNARAQALFRDALGEEIERCIAGITDANRQMDHFRTSLAPSEQTATLELFLHSAVHSVLCSVHHLVSGYPIAAGNLMRHYTESVAMALLCVEPSLGVLPAFTADRRHFPVHDAPTKLRRRKVRNTLEKRLAFDAAAWETVLDIAKLYDQLSHASALALGHQLMLGTEDKFILGGQFDPAKIEPYRSDLVRRASAAESLAHLIAVITGVVRDLQAV